MFRPFWDSLARCSDSNKYLFTVKFNHGLTKQYWGIYIYWLFPNSYLYWFTDKLIFVFVSAIHFILKSCLSILWANLFMQILHFTAFCTRSFIQSIFYIFETRGLLRFEEVSFETWFGHVTFYRIVLSIRCLTCQWTDMVCCAGIKLHLWAGISNYNWLSNWWLILCLLHRTVTSPKKDETAVCKL